MIIGFLIVMCGISVSFTAGWVVGRYGHAGVPQEEGQILIASELARVNRKEWK